MENGTTPLGGVVVERVAPRLEGGFAVHATAGSPVRIEAVLLKEGHARVAGVLRWRRAGAPADGGAWSEIPLEPAGEDTWSAAFVPPTPGRYEWEVETWPRLFATWQEALRRRRGNARALASELLAGAALLDDAAARAASADRALLRAHAERLRTGGEDALEWALSPASEALAARAPDRHLSTRSERCTLLACHPRAHSGAWYELFPRSTGAPGQHGTFATTAARLEDVASLGFDVVYLPPIHPIGRTGRKGRNNTPRAVEGDVGSPWAIGSDEGGHEAVHPGLGTLDDFARLLDEAKRLGLEIALDLAFQCSPDHPWLAEHPEWFPHRPDGTIPTAENPPKRYDDVVNFDWLGPHHGALWEALYAVTELWVQRGVRLFRVDNPHTKPLPFWEWFLDRFSREHPDVVFLSEAFTRPALMYALARRGFHQSYTYFTWRTSRAELRAFVEEISRPPVSEFFHGNLWPNTPDILPEHLQRGGPPAFKLRLALAALLSPSYGIYSGFELCEGRALHGEEYLDSEKYQLVHRTPDRPGQIRHWVQRLNTLRRAHAAFRAPARNVRFVETDSDSVLAWTRWEERAQGGESVLVVVSLDPYAPRAVRLQLPAEVHSDGSPVELHELLSGKRQLLSGPALDLTLTPDSPAAAWVLPRPHRDEHAFEYFA